MMMIRSSLSVVAVLFTVGIAAADNLKSGPQVGDRNPGGFSSLFVNGEHAGKKRCPV
jgi:hypothetical protein